MKRILVSTCIFFFTAITCLSAADDDTVIFKDETADNSASLYTQKLLWKYAAAGKLAARPAVSADGVYLYSEDRHIHALTAGGALRWKFRITGRPADSLSIGRDGSVYACSSDGNLFAVNPAGQQLWKHELPDSPVGEPAVSVDGTVFLCTESGLLYAISHTGFIRWAVDTGGGFDSPPVIDAGEAVYTFTDSGGIKCWSPWGSLVWEKPNPEEHSFSGRQAAVHEHVLYTSAGRRLYAVKPDGGELWSAPLPAECTAIIIIPDAVLCVFSDGSAAALDFRGGVLWHSDLTGLSSYPAAGDNCVYILRGTKLSRMSFTGGLISETEPAGLTLMQPVLGNNILVCGTREWVACAFEAESTLESGWTQKGGGAAHDGASGEKKWHFNPVAYNSNMDYLYLRSYLNTGEQRDKLEALDEIEQRIAEDGIDRGENYLLHLVHQALTGSEHDRYYPAVRVRAAEILGVYGSFESVELLAAALNEEEQPHVSAALITALGKLGTDYKGLASAAIYTKIVRENNKMYDRLVFAGIEAAERMIQYNGASTTGYAYRILLEIMRGGYSSGMRRKALEVLRSIK